MQKQTIEFGKRLQSSKDRKMFYRFPGSPTVKTLPAGKPSPVIESYILQDGGYYQVKGDAGGAYYIPDGPDLNAVPSDAPDQSSIFNTLYAWAGDAVENTVTTVEKNAGYVSDGFDQATANLSGDLVTFGGDLRKIILAGVALLILSLIIIFTSKLN